jgi:hypothetical protein
MPHLRLPVVAHKRWGIAQERIEATDRAGLEHLLRYCARPIFAGERLAWVEAGERLVYYLPKLRADGQTILSLIPLELLNRLAPLILSPRRHRHRYYGVLAPNVLLRAAVTAHARLPIDTLLDEPSLPAPAKVLPTKAFDPNLKPRPRFAYLWAWLLARIYEVLPLICPRCGGSLTIIALSPTRIPFSASGASPSCFRLAVQGTPSLACPFAGKKVHRTFFSFRLTLKHLGEPT